MNNKTSPEKLITFCKTYSDIFTDELNEKSIPVEKNTYIISTLWLKIIEINKGVIVLADTGLATNSFTLIRSMSEAYILMKKCIQSPLFSETYFNKMYKEKSKRLASISKSLDIIRIDLTTEHIEALRAEFNEKISEDQINDYRIKDLFYELEEINLYELVYRHCTIYAHNEASALENYLEETQEHPKLVSNKNIYHDTILTCLMAASLHMKSFQLYCNFIGHDSVSVKKIYTDYDAIQETYRGQT
jgi:hypothetical protein